MLIDEGVLGTFHCGFGSNITIGGLNKINFHLDFVSYQDNLIIDGETIKIWVVGKKYGYTKRSNSIF